jgi:hypothetical protein
LALPALRSSASEAGWTKTKLAIKLAFQAGFVEDTLLAKTFCAFCGNKNSVNPV